MHASSVFKGTFYIVHLSILLYVNWVFLFSKHYVRIIRAFDYYSLRILMYNMVDFLCGIIILMEIF